MAHRDLENPSYNFMCKTNLSNQAKEMINPGISKLHRKSKNLFKSSILEMNYINLIFMVYNSSKDLIKTKDLTYLATIILLGLSAKEKVRSLKV